MACDLYIYEVGPLDEPMPELINTDTDPLPEDIESMPLDQAKLWQKEIGEIHTLEYESIDEYDAVEKILGKRPNGSSCSSHYYLSADDSTARKTFFFQDGSSEQLTRAQLRPYRYTKHEQVYLYRKKSVYDIQSFYLSNSVHEDRFLTKADIIDLVKNFIIENGEDGYEYQTYAGPVYQLMYLYFTLNDDAKLIAVAD